MERKGGKGGEGYGRKGKGGKWRGRGKRLKVGKCSVVKEDRWKVLD